MLNIEMDGEDAESVGFEEYDSKGTCGGIIPHQAELWELAPSFSMEQRVEIQLQPPELKCGLLSSGLLSL